MRRTTTNTGNTRVKLIATIITLVICLTSLFGTTIWAATVIPEATDVTAAEAMQMMSDAEEVKVIQNYATWFKKDYAVVADGTCIGHVTGTFWKLGGDVFTFTSGNGEVIAKGDEEVLHLTNQAQFYDAAGNETGRYEQDVWSLLPKSHFLGNNGEKKATVTSSIFNLSTDIEEGENKTYDIGKNFLVSEYTIKNVADSNMAIEDIVLIVCINDAINTSNNKSSND